MSTSLRTLLVDDEPLARSLVRELLAEFPEMTVAGECQNGTEALAALQTGAYDVVFLDVQMPDLDGVQVLQRLQAAGQPLPLVVFVTAYDQYAVAAFALHAVDYLLKPLDPDRFAECVGRVQQQAAQRHTQAVGADLAALLRAGAPPRGPPPTPPHPDPPYRVPRPVCGEAARAAVFRARGRRVLPRSYGQWCAAAHGPRGAPGADLARAAGRAARPSLLPAHPSLGRY
jgi:CheY-like chemotaxis protein